jgi:hypothetical protein
VNDEVTGQLTADWKIPPYAQSALWLENDASDPVPLVGEHGLFTLAAPADRLTLRWGGGYGPALARLRWQADNLEWDGRISFGGVIDTLHLMQLSGLPHAVAVLTMGGQPLEPDSAPYLSARARGQVPYDFPRFDMALSDVEETVITWLVGEDSPLLGLAQDALVSRLPVYAFGRLAAQDGGWHHHFALPVLLQALTLFAA